MLWKVGEVFLIQEGSANAAHYVVLLSVVVGVFLCEEFVARKRWRYSWGERDYAFLDSFFSPRNTSVRAGIVVAAGVGLPVMFGWDVLSGAVFALAAYSGYAATFFDVTQTKIPKETCWAVFVVGSSTVFADYLLVWFSEGSANNAGLASYAVSLVSTVVITLFLAFITRGGFGSGDVRYIVLLSPLGFWVGYSALLLALLLASIFQIFVYVVRRVRSGGGGASRMLPFAPSLTAGYVVSILLFASSAQACAEWANTVSCR